MMHSSSRSSRSYHLPSLLWMVALGVPACSDADPATPALGDGSSDAGSSDAGSAESSSGAGSSGEGSSGEGSSGGEDSGGATEPPRYSFPDGVRPGGIAYSSAADAVLICDSGSGQLFRVTSATPLPGEVEPFADLTEQGLSGCSALAVAPDGRLVTLSAFPSRLCVVDVGASSVECVDVMVGDGNAPGGGGPAIGGLQLVAVAGDGLAYATSMTEKALYRATLSGPLSVERVELDGEFPIFADTSTGFVNGQGIAAAPNGDLILGHVVEHTLYRVAVGGASLTVTRIDTGSDNYSPNGMAFGSNGRLYVALADAQQVGEVEVAPDLSEASYTRIFGASKGIDAGAAQVAEMDGGLFVLNSGLGMGGPPGGGDTGETTPPSLAVIEL